MSERPEPDNVIRITPADAASPHVDDLLNRQAALRGDRGIAARRGHRWYYSNWFVFMLAGGLGAFLGWALLEPFYSDFMHYQGLITQINTNRQNFDDVEIAPSVRFIGILTVNKQKFGLTSETKFLDERGRTVPFDLEQLEIGAEVGVHTRFAIGQMDPDQGVPVEIFMAEFIEPNPPPAPPAPKSLQELRKLDTIMNYLLFPVVAAVTGLLLGAADGLVCRLLRRMLLCGLVGLLVGFLGGFFSGMLAEVVYGPITMLALQQTGEGAGGMTTLGFLTQMGGRGLAWLLAGMAMGLGQGIALRSGRLFLYGFLGGAIGGLLGGLLFDPIDLLLLGGEHVSAHLSRMVGITIVGATVGLMIGIVELLARDAWLQMVEGPLAGKEFLIFKDRVNVGGSPRSDIYLFNDDQVAARHAVIRSAADQYEIEAADAVHPLLLNGRTVTRSRLRHGDQITLGRTIFVFQRRKSD